MKIMEMSVGAIERYNKDSGMRKIWDFNQKFKVWAEVEIAVMEAKEELDLIPKRTVPEIKGKIMALFGLNLIDSTVEKIVVRDKLIHHDMKAFVEIISETLSEHQASFLHAGVTSYDIEDTALALDMVRSIEILYGNLANLSCTLYDISREFKHQPQIFRTHGVHAQPGTFGLKILGWYAELKRHLKDLESLRDKVSIAKLSGAVGTYAEIDPKVEKLALEKLRLKRAIVSTQIVSRDIHADFVSTLARIAGSLDKFATEIRNLQRTEILEVEESFRKGQVGSSAMPHKRNPIRCENVCSLARIVKAFAMVSFDNQNTWHERDLANSGNERFILPYSAILLNHMIKTFIKVMGNIVVYPENMEKNLEKTSGLIASSKVMLALADKGMSREKAHKLVQKHALKAFEEKKDFKDILLGDPKITRLLAKEEIEQCLDPKEYLKEIDKIFSRFNV